MIKFQFSFVFILCNFGLLSSLCSAEQGQGNLANESTTPYPVKQTIRKSDELRSQNATEARDAISRVRDRLLTLDANVGGEKVSIEAPLGTSGSEGFAPNKITSADDSKYVIAKDDRQMVDPVFPFTCVGRLVSTFRESHRNTSCTATLIGDNLIVTAAHCVPWTEEGIGPSIFAPYYVDGTTPLGSSQVVYWYYLEEIRTHEDYNRPGVISRDVAIGVLERALGKHVGYLGYKPFNDDWTGKPLFALAGYSGDWFRGHRMGVDLESKIVTRDGEGDEEMILLHDGDMNPGASGGPILASFDGGSDVRIVAINSGHRGPEGKSRVPEWTKFTTNLAVDCANWGKLVTELRKKHQE